MINKNNLITNLIIRIKRLSKVKQKYRNKIRIPELFAKEFCHHFGGINRWVPYLTKQSERCHTHKSDKRSLLCWSDELSKAQV